MVTENSLKIRPIWPDMKTNGINTAANDNVIDNIEKLISFAPSIDAFTGLSPKSSIRRIMFSKNTIASSTRSPIDSVNAINDKLSIL